MTRLRLLLRDLSFVLDIAVVVCLVSAAVLMVGAVLVAVVALIDMAVIR